MEVSELTGRERNFLHNIQRWEPPDRGRYAEAIIEAKEELESVGAMIRYLLGKSGACSVLCFTDLTVWYPTFSCCLLRLPHFRLAAVSYTHLRAHETL